MESNNNRMVSSFEQEDDDEASKDKLRPSESAETSSKYPTAEESVDEGTSLGGLNVEARSSAIVEPTNGLEEQVLKSKQQIDLQDEPRPNQTTPVTVDQELHEEGNGHVKQTERHSSLPGSPEQVAAHSVSTGRSLIVTPSPKRSAVDPATRGAFGVHQDSTKFEDIATDNSVAEALTDLSNDKKNWQTLPRMIYPRGSFGSVVVGGKIYVFGGSNGSDYLDTAEVYDPILKKWSPLPRMTFAHSGSSCAAIGDDIYIIGGVGASNRPYDSVEIYNVVNQKYRRGVPMPFGRERHCSVSIDNKVYVLGGRTAFCSALVTQKTFVFDEATQIWSNLALMNTKRSGFSALSHDGKIYAMGGMTTGKNSAYSRFFNSMEVYDVKRNEWKPSKEMKNRRYGCSSFLVGSQITVLGGCDEKDFVQAVETFDINKKKWKQSLLPSPGIERKEFASFIEGSKLIIIGGNGNINLGRKDTRSIDSVDFFGNAAELIACTDVLDINVPEENKSSNLDARNEKLRNSSRKKKPAIKNEDTDHLMVPMVSTRLRPRGHTKQSSNRPRKTQKPSSRKKGEKRAQETPETRVRPKKQARQSSNQKKQPAKSSQILKKPPIKKGKDHKKQARQSSNQKISSKGTKQFSKTSKQSQKSPMKKGKGCFEFEGVPAEPTVSTFLGDEMIEMKKRMEAKKMATIEMEEEWFGSAKEGPLCNRIDELKAKFSS